MSDLYETLRQLTDHYAASLPGEPSCEQTALLTTAQSLLYRLHAVDIAATRAQELTADIGDLLDEREALEDLLAGKKPGRSLLIYGIDALVDHAESMASFITAG